ncbi:MAG: hypothetical protein KZQ81_04470 [Candidatus Thiodiazotropha sp. (ex Rostrolucina anterorostrata)]|nr:hypothetical protein [Candidatus Thiodiazotropha sp. (ex Rostrolucina anterorostrata)]
MKLNKGLVGIAIYALIHSAPIFAYKAMSHEAITNHVASRTILSNEELMAGMEYLGDDRLLGWVRVSADELDDYPGYVPFHLSHDGGMSWSNALNAPFDQSCESFSVWEGQVKDVIYIGKSPDDKDVMIALTQCVEVFEDSSSSSPGLNRGPVTGESLFFTRGGGANWNKVRLPPGHNQDGIILYAGDNGAIPGLYTPEN